MKRDHDFRVGAQVLDWKECTAQLIAVDPSQADDMIFVRLEDQTTVVLPTSLLREDAGHYRFEGEFDRLREAVAEDLPSLEEGATKAAEDTTRIPVVEEELLLGRKVTETGAGVRIVKRVTTSEEVVDQALIADQYSVEHIPRNQLLEEGDLPRMREESDGTLILPVLEEVLVVQKRTRLREEIRITRNRRECHAPQQVVLLREEVDVQKFEDKSHGRNAA